MKATLVALLLKVNADVEFVQESRTDDRVRRYGAQRVDARPGPVAAARAPHAPPGTGRTQAWRSSPTVSARTSPDTVVIVARRKRAHTRPGHKNNLNKCVENMIAGC